jgi:hypothetical protein
MNTSFSKESLSSWTALESSIPTSPSDPKSPSQSERPVSMEFLSPMTTGNLVLPTVSLSGAQDFPQLKGVRSVHSISLRSKVAPERLLESPLPQRRILRIGKADLGAMSIVLDQYRADLDKLTL